MHTYNITRIFDDIKVLRLDFETLSTISSYQLYDDKNCAEMQKEILSRCTERIRDIEKNLLEVFHV